MGNLDPVADNRASDIVFVNISLPASSHEKIGVLRSGDKTSNFKDITHLFTDAHNATQKLEVAFSGFIDKAKKVAFFHESFRGKISEQDIHNFIRSSGGDPTKTFTIHFVSHSDLIDAINDNLAVPILVSEHHVENHHANTASGNHLEAAGNPRISKKKVVAEGANAQKYINNEKNIQLMNMRNSNAEAKKERKRKEEDLKEEIVLKKEIRAYENKQENIKADNLKESTKTHDLQQKIVKKQKKSK